MDDLINRQDVIDAVIKYCTRYDLRELLADIEVLPSVEQAQATLDDVSNAYENGYQQGKFEALQWIPVSERLPKVGEGILATITDDSYKNPVIIRHYEPELEEKILVAWMPLPKPYTEDRDV